MLKAGTLRAIGVVLLVGALVCLYFFAQIFTGGSGLYALSFVPMIFCLGLALACFGLAGGRGQATEPAEEPPREPGTGNGYCPNCGSPIGEGERFCGACGRRLRRMRFRNRNWTDV